MPRMSIRRTHGAAILAEGVVGLLMVVAGLVLAALMLLNVGGASYYKEKIGFIADEAASYAATLPNDANRQGLVNTQVGKLLAGMGFNAANSTTTISDLTIESKPAVKVTVSMLLPTMLSANFASLMPSQLQISDTAVAVDPRYFWAYASATTPYGSKYTATFVNATGALPKDNLPAYNISLQGMSKVR